MSKEKVDKTDFVDHDEADDIIDGDGEDLGNDLVEDEEEEESAKKPAKKAAKKPEKKVEKDEEEEEEEEDEEEEEEEDEEEAPEEDPERAKLAKKLARVGRAREQMEKQLNQLRSQLAEQNRDKSEAAKQKVEKLAAELEDLYDKVEEYRAEGKTSEAAKAQRRIDEIRDGMTRNQAAAIALNEAISQTETRAYNQMVRELETLDPRFDPDHDDFDQDLLDSIGELVEGYEGKGMALTDALRKACKLVLREDPFLKGRPLSREEKKREPDKKVERKTDVKKNVAAAKKQPPDTPNARREKPDADVDMATISEKDFDALPEATLRRILGSEG